MIQRIALKERTWGPSWTQLFLESSLINARSWSEHVEQMDYESIACQARKSLSVRCVRE